MTYTQMMSDKGAKRPVKKTWLWLFILAGATFSFVFGDQISAFEDRMIDAVVNFFKK